ncbi:MAG TPA: potassium transporter TrkG [Herpetosiphonaceae bacterium]
MSQPPHQTPPDRAGSSPHYAARTGRRPQPGLPAGVTHPYSPQAKRNTLILVVGFALLITIGTLLLRLPIAGTSRSLTWSEAFFTATSAATVTGLNVVPTATGLSLWGQWIVLVLIELGGVGFITFSVLLFALIGRRLGIGERVLVQQSLGVLHTGQIARLALSVLGITLAIQAAGALLLWLRWWPSLGARTAAYQALFHAVSAFCNAGFDLFAGTNTVLFGFGRDPYTLGVLMALVIIGGLGVLVMADLITYPWDRRLSVYTKLILITNAVLTALGFLVVLADEQFAGTALVGMPLGDRLLVTLFSVVSARTAGMTMFPIDQLSQASALVLMALMFIGGAPASMAGGVTISTVAVLWVTVLSTVRGQPQGVIFGRVFPFETIAKAVAIMSVSTVVCFVITLSLLAIQPRALLPIAFEVISAFSNTGYSLGETTNLTPLGRLLIAFTMFWGRLGPLTLVIMLAQVERPTLARYPAERIIIG